MNLLKSFAILSCLLLGGTQTPAAGQEKSPAAAEKAAPAAVPLRKNVIVNGDFSLVENNGMPTGWCPKGADYQTDKVPWQNDAKVIEKGSEKFLRFTRTTPVELSNIGPIARIDIPARAKKAVVSARLRVKDLVPAKNYSRYPGVSIKALDSLGNSPGNATAATMKDDTWRAYTAELVLQPGARTLDVSLGPWKATGTCDFDDVVVKFE